jgi:CcmD family protein
MSDLAGIMLVTLIIWVGLFAYVYRLDRKARRLEMGDL